MQDTTRQAQADAILPRFDAIGHDTVAENSLNAFEDMYKMRFVDGK